MSAQSATTKQNFLRRSFSNRALFTLLIVFFVAIAGCFISADSFAQSSPERSKSNIIAIFGKYGEVQQPGGFNGFLVKDQFGKYYMVNFSNCDDSGKECKKLIFTSQWLTQRPIQNELNSYNHKISSGKALSENTGEVSLRMASILPQADIENFLLELFMEWHIVNEMFKEIVKIDAIKF